MEKIKNLYFKKLHGNWSSLEGVISNGVQLAIANKLLPVSLQYKQVFHLKINNRNYRKGLNCLVISLGRR